MKRLNFLKAAATIAVRIQILPRHVLGQGQMPPSQKWNIAGLGLGGQGRGLLNGITCRILLMATTLAEPAVIVGDLSPASRTAFPISLRAAADASPGVRIVALDMTLDGQRHSELFDLVVGIKPGSPDRK